jgi:hypothetical protein
METMQRCAGCRRHVMASAQRCPFCGASVGLVMVWPARWVAIALVGTVVGCTDRVVPFDEGTGNASSGDTTIDASAGTTMPGTSVGTNATTGFTTTTTTDATTGTNDTGIVDTGSEADTIVTTVGFIYGAPDGGGVNIECDVWAQDCPRGEKCMPWANDGGSSWNATRCSPIEPDPMGVGETCTVEDSGVSGIDDCELGAMCWNVDADTLMGTCVAQCSGTEANPECPADFSCMISNAGTLTLCLPSCDPLAPACAANEICAPVDDQFFCLPDFSGDAGVHGDPCEFITACDPGLFCANSGEVPGCEGSIGCCAEFCDTTITADQQCTGFADGEDCVPWFMDGEAPMGLEQLGACVIRQ